jgi:protein gp37
VRFLSIEPLLEGLGALDLRGIHWVIVGGESGRGARPMKREWVVSIRDQCANSGVPFFFKQWGGVRKKREGRELEGKTYDEFPRRHQNPVCLAADRLQWAAEIEQRHSDWLTAVS